MTDLRYQHNIDIERLMVRRNEAAKYINENKERAAHLARRVPIELLAVQWLNEIDASIETRAYLMENFLPVLVLGCEKVLKEAHKRNLIEGNKSDLNYNPLNFLAQYLMRSNPKYNNFNETSSYMRTIREVYLEVREQMYTYQENKLARIKADVRHRRDDREKKERLRQLEKERRNAQVDELFRKWLLSDHGRIEMSIVLNVFKLYQSQINILPNEMRANAKLNYALIPSFCYHHDKINPEKRMMKAEFIKCVISVSDNMPSDLFDYFVEFFGESASYFIGLGNKNRVDRILSKLFDLLDYTKTGYLFRKILLDLLKKFYNESYLNEENFRNPNRWPVVDPFIKFENEEFENGNLSSSIILDGDEKGEEMQDAQARNSVDGRNSQATANDLKPKESTSLTSIKKEFEIKKDSESIIEGDKMNASMDAESMAKINIIDQQTLENLNPQSAHETIQNMDDSKQNENDSSTNKQTEDNYMKTLKDSEILFIKGGIMHYSPLQEYLNAFDKNMVTSITKNSDIVEFDTEFLNQNQFVNLVNNVCFSKTYASEQLLNILIHYIKDNYAETRAEKNMKIEHMNSLKTKRANLERLTKIFGRLDNECSSFLELDFVTELMESFKDGMYKDTIGSVYESMKNEILNQDKNAIPNQIEINKDEFIKYLTLIINQLSPMFADQMCQYLHNTLQFDYPQRVRGEHRKNWLDQLTLISDISTGSFDALYKELFLNLLKDAENHGDGKSISAYVAILEKKSSDESVLRYHASTPQDAKVVLGKVLTRNMDNVSFEVIDTGRLVHIQSVRENGKVHFFDSHNNRDGSLVVLPLKYRRNRIYGIIGIDTLQDTTNEAVFNDHEIKFYQGVASTFAKAYASIIFKNRLVKCCINAVEWLGKRCEHMQECNLYFVEKIVDNNYPSNGNNESSNIKLRPIIKYMANSLKIYDDNTNKAESSENYIKPHVYDCVRNSESSIGYFNKEISYCYSLRNEEHKTIFVFETIFQKENNAQDTEVDIKNVQQIESVLYVLHKCQEELLEEILFGENKNDFVFEDLFEQDKYEILFEKRFYNYIFDQLKKYMNLGAIDTNAGLSDKIIKLADMIINVIADFVDLPNFATNRMITQELISKLRSIDPTGVDFSLSKISGIDLSSETALSELNKIQLKLQENINTRVICLFVDLLCVIKKLNEKTIAMAQQ